MKKLAPFWHLLGGCLLLTACVPKTSVILLPDESGKVGSVIVHDGKQATVLDKAYTRIKSQQSTPEQLDEKTVNTQYAKLLKAQPRKAPVVQLCFITGISQLNAQSEKAVDEMVNTVRDNMPTEITLIGHADTTGSDETNLRLAQERADMVKRLLQQHIPAGETLAITAYGSKTLLVPTAPNVDEPRNRCVEVLIL